jgi:hypothetical protein
LADLNKQQLVLEKQLHRLVEKDERIEILENQLLEFSPQVQIVII